MGKTATCHPDRKHKARGLCDSCYTIYLVNRTPKTYAKFLKYQKKYYQSRPVVRSARIQQAKTWRKTNPTRTTLHRLRRSLKNRGITETEYQTLLKKQHERCAICLRTAEEAERKRKRLCIDHDHDTGKVRGLLCGTCNQALGLLRESSILLRRALEYVCMNV